MSFVFSDLLVDDGDLKDRAQNSHGVEVLQNNDGWLMADCCI